MDTRKIYLITETHSDGDESESWTSVSDTVIEPSQDGEYKTEYKEVGIDDVTLERLADAVDDELENANYHRLVGIGKWIANHLEKAVGPEKAKQTFWDMIQDKGLLWDEF